MKNRKLVVNIGKLLAVSITLSFCFSFGWYTTHNYMEAQEETVDTMYVAPQTFTFYDTVAVAKVHYDTLDVELPEETPPPRPWGSKGRP